jgi:hypothetical protein
MRTRRTFELNQRVAERPRRNIGDSRAFEIKRGKVVGFREVKQKTRIAKSGFAMRRQLQVHWDGRTVADWIEIFRVIPEEDLEREVQLTRNEV